jgi:type VI secretion system protein VasD
MAALAGCSSPKLGVSMSSTANLNMNEDNEPLTVVVRVYQLSRAETFKSASFRELWRNDLATLGDAALVKEEIVMEPASSREISMEPKRDARYVAVMAGFREASGDDWKAIKRLPDGWLSGYFDERVRVSLEGNSVSVE